MGTRFATCVVAAIGLAVWLESAPTAYAQFASGAIGGLPGKPPPRTEEVESLLQRKNLTVRRRGASFLGELGEKAKAISPTIHKSLDDPDPRVHVPAALWMAKHEPGHPSIVPLLMKSFDADVSDLWARMALVVKDLEPGRTGEVVRALFARIEAPRPAAEESALGSGTPDLFWDAVHALTPLGPAAQPALPALLARFEPSPGEFNGRLVSPLREIGGPAAELALGRAVKDAKDPKVRWDACEALLAAGPPTRDIALAMLEVLDADTDGSVGFQSFGFKKVAIAFPEVLENLVKLLEHGWPRQRGRAAHLLGLTGPDAKGSVSALLRACKDDDAIVRASAIDALVAITEVPPAEVLDVYVNALEDADKRVVVRALRGIASRSDDPDVHAAVERLIKRDSNHDVLAGIIFALKPIRVLQLAKHQDAIVRERVLHAIALAFRFSEPSQELAASLTPFLADTEPRVRRAALGALDALANISKVERLPNGLPRDRPLDVRWVGETIVPEVVKLLDDPDGDVRRQVPLTLRALGSGAIEGVAPSAEQRLATAVSGPASQVSGGRGNSQGVSDRNHQDSEVTPEIIAHLVDSLRLERNWESVSTLRDLGKRSVLVEQALIELIERKSSRWRELEAALRVLSEVGSKACICPLVRSHQAWLARTDKPVGEIGETLITIGPEPTEFVPCLVQVGVVTNQMQAPVLARVLRAIGPEVVAELVALSQSSNVRKRQVSAWGLWLYGDVGQNGLDALIRLSQDPDRKCSEIALGALGKVGHWPPAVVDGLLERWFEQECPESLGAWTERAGEYDYVRAALSKCGNAAIERLITAMETGDHRTRLLAAEALSTSGCPEPLRPRLQRLAHDVDDDKRTLTRELLERLNIPLRGSAP